MTKTTKCDGCHKKRKLYFFKHQVDSGYSAYCKECAVKYGVESACKEYRGMD